MNKDTGPANTVCTGPLPISASRCENSKLAEEDGGAIVLCFGSVLEPANYPVILLIPLTTDQPIQAEILRRTGAGIALYPDEINEETMRGAFQRLLDTTDPVHQRRLELKTLFSKSDGAVVAANMIENVAAN